MKNTRSKAGSQHALVRCVFGATLSKGPFKGEMYECGAAAIGDYYDPLYKCRRPVCKRHMLVVVRKADKWKRAHTFRSFSPNATGSATGEQNQKDNHE